MVNTQALRALSKGKDTPEPQDRTLTRDKLAHGRIIACDPSLSATGIIRLEHYERLEITFAATLRGDAPEGWTGYRKETAEAVHLRSQLSTVMGPMIDGEDLLDLDMWAVREAPPIGGGHKLNPASSIQAGLVFDLAAMDLGIGTLPMVAVESHRTTICGGRVKGMSKAQYHRDHLMPLADQLGVEGLSSIKNADLRDALAVGLTALSRGLT